jgi:transposase-like protein
MVEISVEARSQLINLVNQADGDVLRELLSTMIHALMNAEVDVLCGARHGERSADRVNHRNGYRARPLDTRVGTLDLAIPRVRQGSYLPEWLLEPRRRAERALVAVVAECYVTGVSTRKVEKVAQAMGIDALSRSQVSEMAKSLDAAVETFRTRRLNEGPYPYVWMDALMVKSREMGRVVNVAVIVATAVNREGRKVILGVDVVTSEDGAGWEGFLRSLVTRGLNGVQLVVSDAHEGLKNAVAKVLPGSAWQRCRTHFMRNLLTRVPKKAQEPVAALVRSIFAQADAEETHGQHGRVVEQLAERFPQAAQMLSDAEAEILAFADFPKEHWRQIWSNNPQERLNREIRRRTDVVGIFPNRSAIVRLVGAVLVEQDEEWTVSRRYMSLETVGKVLRRSKEQIEPPALPEAA